MMRKKVFYCGGVSFLPVTLIYLYTLIFYLKFGMLAPLDPKKLNAFLYDCLLYIYPMSFLTFVVSILLLFSLYKRRKHSLMIINILIIIFFVIANVICFKTLFNWFID